MRQRKSIRETMTTSIEQERKRLVSTNRHLVTLTTADYNYKYQFLIDECFYSLKQFRRSNRISSAGIAIISPYKTE